MNAGTYERRHSCKTARGCVRTQVRRNARMTGTRQGIYQSGVREAGMQLGVCSTVHAVMQAVVDGGGQA